MNLNVEKRKFSVWMCMQFFRFFQTSYKKQSKYQSMPKEKQINEFSQFMSGREIFIVDIKLQHRIKII